MRERDDARGPPRCEWCDEGFNIPARRHRRWVRFDESLCKNGRLSEVPLRWYAALAAREGPFTLVSMRWTVTNQRINTGSFLNVAAKEDAVR